MSAVSVHEICMVLYGATRVPEIVRDVHRVLGTLGIEIHSFDAQQAVAASNAFARYGKGIHPAGLNFGDCAAFALAETQGLPLLFKGSDFARTPIPRATW